MTRVDVIKEMLDMGYHNLFCYSQNYLMTKPREGYEEEWLRAKEKAAIIQQMYDELTGNEGEKGNGH